MFGPDVARRLTEAGHAATTVREVDLGGAEDAEVLAYAVANDHVVVTENAADFVPLLDARIAAGHQVVPVVIALERRLPRGAGAIAHRLADNLTAWAAGNPQPYRHAHWLD